MENCVNCVLLFNIIIAIVFADVRIYFNEDAEKRWNTPPELTPEQIDLKSITDNEQSHSSLFPLSASFILNVGQSKTHGLSLGASENGISLSQSTSHASDGVNQFGNSGPSLSSSQSLSLSAGLNGLPASNANSFALNRPIFDANTEASTNAFTFGQGISSAHGSNGNGHTTSSAQSSAGTIQSVASSETISHIGGLSLLIENTDRSQNSPQWTNLHPNFKNRGSRRPVLTINPTSVHWSEVNRPIGTVKLKINPDDKHWISQEPKISISKWRPELGPDPANTRHY